MVVSNRKDKVMPLKAKKKKILASWKTTLAAVAGTLTTIVTLIVEPLTDGDPATKPMYTVAISIICAGLSGYFSRDDGVSSEDVGLK